MPTRQGRPSRTRTERRFRKKKLIKTIFFEENKQAKIISPCTQSSCRSCGCSLHSSRSCSCIWGTLWCAQPSSLQSFFFFFFQIKIRKRKITCESEEEENKSEETFGNTRTHTSLSSAHFLSHFARTLHLQFFFNQNKC